MRISVTDAKAQLTDLVRRAEAGDEVVLTRHGQAKVRLVAIETRPSAVERARLIRDIVATANPTPGPDAAHSQDFLYDEFGVPK